MKIEIFLVTLIASSNALSSDGVMVKKATLEKAIEMMEESDDWMNSLKFMINNSSRGFKLESRRIVEYDGETGNTQVNPDPENGTQDGRTLLTMVNDVLPFVIENFTSSAAARGRLIPPTDSLMQGFTKIPNSAVVLGNVGVCRTHYQPEKIFSAPLLRDPEGPIATLAHPLPAMVGSCISELPVIGAGSSSGRCVLSGHPHIAWVLVPAQSQKDSKSCVAVPGVTTLVKCSEWIVIGGRCVYDMSRNL